MITLSLNDPETIADYEAIITVYNQAWPDNPVTAAEWQHEDKDWPQKYLFQRFVAKEGDDLILEGAVMEPFWMHVPGKYAFFYSPLPAYDEFQIDGESIHGMVYGFVVEYLAACKPHALIKPHALMSTIREDKLARIQWLLNSGFRETMREADSRLDVANFDAAPFEAVCTRVATSGIEILALPELQARDSDWKVKVHKLYNEIELDVPSPDPPTPEPMEEFEKTFKSPNFVAEGWLIAVDSSQSDVAEVGPYAGLTIVGARLATPEKMSTWVTGVARPYRRRGIALAMKVASIEFARRRGIKFIETDNEENNPMYQINLKLGYEPLPAWVDYEKTLG